MKRIAPVVISEIIAANGATAKLVSDQSLKSKEANESENGDADENKP